MSAVGINKVSGLRSCEGVFCQPIIQGSVDLV